MDSIGVAVVTSDDPNFATLIAASTGVTVAEDTLLRFVEPEDRVVEQSLDDLTGFVGDPTIGDNETFRAAQWAVDAIKAPDAWFKGAQGAGARVAILDGGIHSTHIDIAANLDIALSVSFVPGFAFNQDVGTFWHGTHVAGIVAAPANNIGTVGIAPKATLIGVKVLHNGSGSFGQVISGIYYAATPISRGGAGADVINMSIGAIVLREGKENKKLLRSLDKATRYAHRKGVTVIAAAGNEAINLDTAGKLVSVPAESDKVLAIAATGPVGFGLGATNFTRPASYTNSGKTVIALAAPGGDFVLPGNDICSFPRKPSGTQLQFCWALDMIIAPVRGSRASVSTYAWAAGTSMASPAVAGVAALIIGQKGGKMDPDDVEDRLRDSATELSPRRFYGSGFVNAAKAVKHHFAYGG